jgi:hypothetical protein
MALLPIQMSGVEPGQCIFEVPSDPLIVLPVKTWELGASKVLGLIGAQYMVAKATMQTLGLLHS